MIQSLADAFDKLDGFRRHGCTVDYARVDQKTIGGMRVACESRESMHVAVDNRAMCLLTRSERPSE